MRKQLLSILGIAAILGGGGLSRGVEVRTMPQSESIQELSKQKQATQAPVNQNTQPNYIKHRGFIPGFGAPCASSPIWFGKGNNKKRTNRLRCSHNSKLKRRKCQ